MESAEVVSALADFVLLRFDRSLLQPDHAKATCQLELPPDGVVHVQIPRATVCRASGCLVVGSTPFDVIACIVRLSRSARFFLG
jgi:hypothetical protein